MPWPSFRAWFDFRTLRGRYLGITLLSVLFVMACALIAHIHSRREIDKGYRHLALLRETISQFTGIEDTLRHADEHLAVLLFTPSEKEHGAWHRHMEEVLGQVKALNRGLVPSHESLRTLVGAFMADLHTLMDKGEILYRMRRDPRRTFPVFSILQDITFQANIAFKGAARTAMEALEGDPRYPILAEVRILWGDMTFWLAVYTLNRLFDPETSQDALVHNIDLLREEILKRLKALEGVDILEVQDALETMREAERRWMEGFREVLKLRTLEDWRRDVAFYRKEIGPVIERVHKHIDAIDAHLAEMLSRDVEGLSGAARLASMFLWSIALLASGIALAGFLYMEKTVLHPIERLARALRGFPERKIALPRTDIEEIRSLIDAYALMTWIVSRRHRELEEEAQRDPLTGLLNRRAFLYHLSQLIPQSLEAGASFALIMIDLDGFKAINDTYGHAMGDAFLKEAGKRLAASVRDVDIPARYGGDEFVVLLPFADEAQAVAVCQRVTEALKRPVQIQGKTLKVGASAGIALFPRHGQDGEALIQKADAAMYQAKRAGGGCRVAS
ncbi:MAG: GGDEF domain-containing protein [Gammaproteobacteria bacterium]|nr:MAG: GGDEF domain-containing protein [Gammaproteobacteria bacterium]